jgi:hypothetical protein
LYTISENPEVVLKIFIFKCLFQVNVYFSFSNSFLVPVPLVPKSVIEHDPHAVPSTSNPHRLFDIPLFIMFMFLPGLPLFIMFMFLVFLSLLCSCSFLVFPVVVLRCPRYYMHSSSQRRVTLPIVSSYISLVSFLWAETDSTWYVGHYLAYYTGPGRWMMMMMMMCGAAGGMSGKENPSIRRKSAPVPLCPPQIPHDLTRARIRAAAVESQLY